MNKIELVVVGNGGWPELPFPFVFHLFYSAWSGDHWLDFTHFLLVVVMLPGMEIIIRSLSVSITQWYVDSQFAIVDTGQGPKKRELITDAVTVNTTLFIGICATFIITLLGTNFLHRTSTHCRHLTGESIFIRIGNIIIIQSLIINSGFFN